MRRWVPVDHATAAIDQTFAVKIDKNLLDSLDVIVIERVALARPIARAAKPLELFNDDTAVLVLPFKNAAQEFIATQIVARYSLVFAQPLFDCCLRCNPSVVGTRKPKNLKTLHAGATGENVLDRVVQNMAERQHTSDVRRRHHDRERRLG